MSLTIEGFSGGENLKPELTEQETLIQDITEALVGKVYGANATPETILKGYSAYVHQELVEGTMEPVDIAKLFGYTKYSIDEFSFSSDTAVTNTVINHSLGEIPSMAIICLRDNVTSASNNAYMAIGMTVGNFSVQATKNLSTGVYTSNNKVETNLTQNNFTFTVAIGVSLYKAGATYTLITLA